MARVNNAARIQGEYNHTKAESYRNRDEMDLLTPASKQVIEILGELSLSFGRAISVLDVGCGTGRFFFALRNVARLTGLDVSADMLDMAAHPAHEDQVTAQSIELLCADLYDPRLDNAAYDLVYSVGVFGGCAPSMSPCATGCTKPSIRRQALLHHREPSRHEARLQTVGSAAGRRSGVPVLTRPATGVAGRQMGIYPISPEQLETTLRASQFQRGNIFKMVARYYGCIAERT